MNLSQSEIVVPHAFTSFSGLDLTTGEVRWTVDFGVRIRSTPVILDRSNYGVAIGTDVAHFGKGGIRARRSYRNHLFFGDLVAFGAIILSLGLHGGRTSLLGFDRFTLEKQWEVDLGEEFVVSADTVGPIVDEDLGRAYVTGPAGTVTCVATNGETVWRVQLAGSDGVVAPVFRSSPTLIGEKVIVTSLSGEVFALSSASGDLEWSSYVDPLGIWSPATAWKEWVVVHAGTRLVGISVESGSSEWSSIVGSAAYSRPTEIAGSLIVSGGEMPYDGYLVFIDEETVGQVIGTASTRYLSGEAEDHLTIELTVAPEIESIQLDLGPFGRSGNERMVMVHSGRYRWSGTVAGGKRRALVTVLGRALAAGQYQPFSMCVDSGASEQPSEPSARTMTDAEAKTVQGAPTGSGAAVLALIARHLGRASEAEDFEEAARHLREDVGIELHHVWRAGSGRMLMAGDPRSMDMIVDG